MKINEIVKEEQGTISKIEPGKAITVAMPDGTLITKDLTKDPTALDKDAQGNPIFNLTSQPNQTSSGTTPVDKPLTTGARIEINTTPGETMVSPTLETQEEDEEQSDLISSGNKPIGADQTDSLLSAKKGHGVIDGRFERFARGKDMGNRSMNAKSVLPENDELERWLTIARLK